MEKQPLGKRFKYFALYWFVRFLLAFSNALPRRWWLAFCGWLGKLAYAFSPTTRERVIVHLGLAYSGEKNTAEILALAKRTFVMLGKNAGEIFRSTQVRTREQLEKFLVTTGFEHYEAANAKGKGVIFLTCHLGAFDLQITNMAMRGLQPNIIGTALKDARLNELLVEYRNAHGAIAIERGKETFRLIKALKSGGSVAILIDQDTKVKSRFVNFFGMPAATPVGAAVLAMKTGAAIIPTFVHLGDDHLQHMEIFPALPVVITGDDEADMVTNTQVFTDFIEKQIRRFPDQWVWMHERWKTRPGQEIQ